MSGGSDPATAQALRTYLKLLRATRSVAARVEPLLVSHNLTLTQLGVLEAILHKGQLTHRDLGRKVLTSAGNMTDVVDKLEQRGLVLRLRDPDDRRLVHVALTEAGRTLIAAVFPRHAADIASAMGGLTQQDLAVLGDLLRQLGRHAARPGPEPALAAAPKAS